MDFPGKASPVPGNSWEKKPRDPKNPKIPPKIRHFWGIFQPGHREGLGGGGLMHTETIPSLGIPGILGFLGMFHVLGLMLKFWEFWECSALLGADPGISGSPGNAQMSPGLILEFWEFLEFFFLFSSFFSQLFFPLFSPSFFSSSQPLGILGIPGNCHFSLVKASPKCQEFWEFSMAPCWARKNSRNSRNSQELSVLLGGIPEISQEFPKLPGILSFPRCPAVPG